MASNIPQNTPIAGAGMPGIDTPPAEPGVFSAADLHRLWAARSGWYGPSHRSMDTMVRVYGGALPDEYSDYFHEDQHIHIINNIRLAWDDLATMAGKVFNLKVEPDNDRTRAQDRAQLQEKIGFGYNEAGRLAGGVSMRMLMKVLMWWMVGTANMVAMALPDYKLKTPYFTFRDPRTHYPPVGWSPFTQAAATDALFAYQLPIAELKARYPGASQEITNRLQRFQVSTSKTGRKFKVRARDDLDWAWTGEYYKDETWMVTTMVADEVNITLSRSDQGDPGHPNVMPVVATGLYAADSPKGISLFKDQVSIQAAMARMFSQKLDFFDRTLYPLIFHTPLAGKTIRIGPYATSEFSMVEGGQPKLEVVAPAHQIDADSTMAFVMGLSRMLNRNPEQLQGGGDANSSKALNELTKGITSTVRDWIWPPVLEALPTLYAVAAKMDLAVWPDEDKIAVGDRKNSAFRVNYRPSRDLKNREGDWKVEAGAGLAGFQGAMEIMQLFGAELMPEDDALEQLDSVTDKQGTKRRLEGDRIRKLRFMDLATKAQSNMLNSTALAELERRVEDGQDFYEALTAMEKAGVLLVQPPEAPGGLPGMGGPGGPPGPGGAPPAPGTGPAASFLPLPTMEALQGGPQPRR